MGPSGTYEKVPYVPAVKGKRSDRGYIKEAEGVPLGIRAVVKAV